MIICFTGTGNSRRIADMLQDALGDQLVRLAPGLMNAPEKILLNVPDGRLIWVFPVHSWGVPSPARRTIRNAQIVSEGNVEHYLVCTCGDDIGYTDKQWRSMLAERGWTAKGAFSVQMPNTYVFLPGFDVDPAEVAEAKLAAAPKRLETIIAAIREGSDTIDVVRGNMAWMKSKVLNPLYRKFMRSTKPFHTNDSCGGCGKCSRNCPISTITMVDGRPQWGEKCTMCSRCYHCCPRHAIEYGSYTHGKGQSICPGYTLSD